MRTDPARPARYTLMGTAWLGVLMLGACGPKPANETGRAETPGATDTAATGMAPADNGRGIRGQALRRQHRRPAGRSQ